MATVFMKWLETSPADYDRGIALLTLGRIRQIRERIAGMVASGDRVLEVGCGTGALTMQCARRGAEVTAIDISPHMLAVARRRSSAAGVADQIEWRLMDAASATDHFAPNSFDKIIMSLLLSELAEDELCYVLLGCRRLLVGDGRLIVADEVIPRRLLPRLLFWVVRIPLMVLTWLLTRTTTRVLRDYVPALKRAGFSGRVEETYLGGSLAVLSAQRAAVSKKAPSLEIPRLQHRVTPKTVAKDLWCLFMRNTPPYLSFRPGLYAVGQPDADSPVLVTGNYDLTVRRLLRDIQGTDAYLLIVNSNAINVWCAAGGGHLTGDRIIAAIRTSRLDEVVHHRELILPQLSATGVDGHRIEDEIGWKVWWGPVYARDIPSYLEAGPSKTDNTRWVHFPLLNRLEMAVGMWGFWGLLLGLALLLFNRDVLWVGLGASLFYYLLSGALFPWLPGRNGFRKGLFLAFVSVAAALILGFGWARWDTLRVLNAALGLAALAVFAAADYQGATPHMRAGEIVHFFKVAPLELGLLLLYLILPALLRL